MPTAKSQPKAAFSRDCRHCSRTHTTVRLARFLRRILAMKPRSWFFVCKIQLAAAIILLLLMETGCLAVPSKLPNRLRGTAGVRIEKSDVDFSFIKVGATRRDEVTGKLAAVDVGSPPQFFWGRWAESTWGMVGAGATGGELDPVAGFAERHWRFHNLLLRFDEQGIVQEKLTLDDGQTLWNQLLAFSRNAPAAANSGPLRIPSVDRKYPEIVLSAESIEFRAAKPKPSLVFRFPSPAVIHLRPLFERDVRRPEWNCYSLQVENASAGTKHKARFCAPGQALAQVVAYLDRLPGPAQWEGE